MFKPEFYIVSLNSEDVFIGIHDLKLYIFKKTYRLYAIYTKKITN